jgi:Calcium binding
MIKEDKDREERISMEIVVDAYDETERALGWYYYLEEKLNFPFKAKCIAERPISPLNKGEKVEVIGMPPEDECEKEIFVNIKWQKRTLAVPLAQLAGIEVDEETGEGIEDWHYWVKRGYEF